MKFSLLDYKALLDNNELFFPKNFLPFNIIDKRKYKSLEEEYTKNGLKLAETFDALRSRTGKKYFRKVYPAQSLALNFSESAFPSYRFLMPDVLADDWLAIVDFHKKFSRDHALHQPLTAYIVSRLLGGGDSSKSLLINGEFLLDLCVKSVLESPNTQYLRDYLISIDPQTRLFNDGKLSNEVWKSIFYETAMTAAIFHDVGYPWQYINRLNNSLSICDFNIKQLPSNAKHIIDTFNNRLIMYPFYNYKSLPHNTPCDWNNKLMHLISESLSKTHGFPGALGFLYLNDMIRKYPVSQNTSVPQLCIDWAALGIMMHDMSSVYYGNNKHQPENDFLRLSVDRDPLSCIIALADVLQDFERPLVKFESKDEGSESKYGFACSATELLVIGDEMEIKYVFEGDNDRILNIDFKKQEEKTYFDSNIGYLDLSHIGINTVKMSCE